MGKEKQLKQQVKWGKEKMWYHTEIIVFPYLFEIKSHYVSYCVLDCGDCRHSPPCPAFAILILREDKLPSVGQADKGYLSGDLVFHPKERWVFFSVLNTKKQGAFCFLWPLYMWMVQQNYLEFQTLSSAVPRVSSRVHLHH